MSQATLIIGVAGASVVALTVLVRAVRTARAAGDLDSSSALTFGMGWFSTLTLAVVAIAGGLERRADVFDELIPVLPGWYGLAVAVSLGFLTVLVAVLLVRRLRSPHIPVHAAALVAVVLWSLSHLSSALRGEALFTSRGGVLLLCLLAAAVLPGGRGASLGVGAFAVSLAVFSGLLSVVRFDVAFIPCVAAGADQCSVIGPAFTGALPNQNLLAAVLAASIPFTYLGFRGRARVVLVLYLAGMTIATGSITGVLAATVSVAALLVVRPSLDRSGTPAGRSAIAGLTLAGAAFGSVYFIRHDWDPSALNNRPALWRVAWEFIHRSPLLGYGSETWETLYNAGEIPLAAQRSAHNQWLDVLFVAGGVGGVLLVGVLVAALYASGRAQAGVTIVIATVLLIGTTEPAWSVGTFDAMSFSLIALILTSAPAQIPQSLPSRAQSSPMALVSSASSVKYRGVDMGMRDRFTASDRAQAIERPGGA